MRTTQSLSNVYYVIACNWTIGEYYNKHAVGHWGTKLNLYISME